MRLTAYAPRKARIEMLPIIDTVFLVLVFFVYGMLTMRVERGIPVELPAAATGEPVGEAGATVSISREGEISLNGTKVGLEELGERLADLGGEEEARVSVAAERLVPTELLVRVIDEIRKAGIGSLSIRVEERGGG